jgi:hypothetical protein
MLVIATAGLATLASQVTEAPWHLARVLTAGAAVTAGLATWIQRRVGTTQIRTWTRARSVSEGLKTEIFSALAGGSQYAGAERDEVLTTRVREITDLVDDLPRVTLGVVPDGKPVPAVHDVDSYISGRVADQINNYYTPRAEDYDQRVRRLRFAGDVLGLIAVIVAALGATLQIDGFALWVPVITTVASSLYAYIAASRYDHSVIEFLRTAQRLTRLRDDFLRTHATSPAVFIDACEDAISVENQAWMARWDKPAGEGATN